MGPSIEDYDTLKSAVENGLNVARLNFSHGEYSFHQEMIEKIRSISNELKAPVAILQDLQGPKIRVGKFQGDSLELVPNQVYSLSPEWEVGEGDKIPIDFEGLAESCSPGSRILLDDGLMELEVTEVKSPQVFAKVIEGGKLKNRKGLNIPGGRLPVDCMTEKDLKDLDFGLECGVDYIALSFVRQAEDIRRLKSIINEKRPGTRVIAKIEMLEALDDLENIIEESDAVMVARGDLAIEVGSTMLPGHQKNIIRLCNERSCPVITATQMLDSMVENPRPTRAEITDVANAVLDGSDALMLSAESASGKNPIRCIQTMRDIILEVEKTSDYYSFDKKHNLAGIPASIAVSSCLTARELDASVIVCLTTSGKTATMISSYRPKSKIIAVTNSNDTLNRLELIWGIQSIRIGPYAHSDEAIDRIERSLCELGIAKPGDKVILTLGMPVQEKAKTNTLRVLTIPEGKWKPMSDERLPLRFR